MMQNIRRTGYVLAVVSSALTNASSCSGSCKQRPSELFSNEISNIRKNEEEIRTRWVRDEDNWRKLPARAWPEYQPAADEVPKLNVDVDSICGEGPCSSACTEAKFNLATALLFNNLDTVEGLKLFESLADDGSSAGMTALGVCLVEGFGVEVDYEKGSAWLRRASEAGYVQALYEMGSLYYMGNAEPYVKEDVKEAFQLFEKAAALSHTGGMYMTADMLLCGDGCDKNHSRAVTLLYNAGDRGHRTARSVLFGLLRDEDKIVADLRATET